MRWSSGSSTTGFVLRVLGLYGCSRLVVLAGFYLAALLLALGMPGPNPKLHVRQLVERPVWRWLSGDTELSLPPPPAGGADTLVIQGEAVAPDLKVVVTIADSAIDTLSVGKVAREYRLALPPTVVRGRSGSGGRLKVSLRSLDFSPRELSGGRSSDERRLAFRLMGLRYGVTRATELSIEDPQLVVRGGYLPEGRAQRISLSRFLLGAAFLWDAGWYREIASHGYHFSPAELAHYQSTAFYPLYPLASRAVAAATGAPLETTMLVLANLFAALGVLAFALLLRRTFSAEVAWGATLLLSFFPLSLFLSLPYTESLMLLTMAGTLALLRRGRIVAAAVICGLGTACRPTAAALVAAVLWQHFRPAGRWEVRDVRRWVTGIGLALLASWGMIGYLLYLGTAFATPLAFFRAQGAWASNVVHTPLEMLSFSWVWKQLGSVLVHDPCALIVDPHVWGYWTLPLTFVILFLNRRRIPGSWTLAGALIPLIPYLYYGRTNSGLMSMARYVALDLPVFVGLAVQMANPGRQALLGAIVGVFAAMLLAASVLFAVGDYFVA